MNLDWNQIWQVVVTSVFLKALGGLLALVIVDLVLGVASALKRGKFNWQTLANFYETNIIPKVLGWVVLVFLSYIVGTGLLGAAVTDQFAPYTSGAAYSVVVLALGNSILSNFNELYTLPTITVSTPPAPPPVEPPKTA